MVLFNYSTKEITAKIVYYGPGLCGKTTNLQFIYDNLPGTINKGKMLSLATKTDRTLFFDFLPIDLGTIRGMRTRLQLYTVPGQVFYNTTRKLVLKGADGIVFVADSQKRMLEANIESLRNLEENLAEHELKLSETPLILQFNKRDLPDLLSVEELNNALNKVNAPIYEGVATTGIGVHETLKAITRLVLNSLKEKYADKREHRTGPPAQSVLAAAAAAAASKGAAPPPWKPSAPAAVTPPAQMPPPTARASHPPVEPLHATFLEPPEPPPVSLSARPQFDDQIQLTPAAAPPHSGPPVQIGRGLDEASALFEPPGDRAGADEPFDLQPVDAPLSETGTDALGRPPTGSLRQADSVETAWEEEPVLEVLSDLDLSASDDTSDVLELEEPSAGDGAGVSFGDLEQPKAPDAEGQGESLFAELEPVEESGPRPMAGPLDVTEQILSASPPADGSESFEMDASTPVSDLDAPLAEEPLDLGFEIDAPADLGDLQIAGDEEPLERATGAVVSEDRHDTTFERTGLSRHPQGPSAPFEQDRANIVFDEDAQPAERPSAHRPPPAHVAVTHVAAYHGDAQAIVASASATPAGTRDIELPINLEIGGQRIRFHLRISLDVTPEITMSHLAGRDEQELGR